MRCFEYRYSITQLPNKKKMFFRNRMKTRTVFTEAFYNTLTIHYKYFIFYFSKAILQHFREPKIYEIFKNKAVQFY